MPRLERNLTNGSRELVRRQRRFPGFARWQPCSARIRLRPARWQTGSGGKQPCPCAKQACSGRLQVGSAARQTIFVRNLSACAQSKPAFERCRQVPVRSRHALHESRLALHENQQLSRGSCLPCSQAGLLSSETCLPSGKNDLRAVASYSYARAAAMALPPLYPTRSGPQGWWCILATRAAGDGMTMRSQDLDATMLPGRARVAIAATRAVRA
jgi:hypothetical protein